jgi:glycosyltransferase involved in cell wall biosynthesis
MSRVEDHIVMDQPNESSGRRTDGSPVLKPLRVLHLATGNIFGGVETFLLTLARSAKLEPLMTPEFAVCFPGRLRDELAATDCPVHDFGPVRISRPWTVWRARRRLRAVLRASRPDRVVVHGTWSRAVFGPVVRREGLPLVFYVHGPISEASFIDRCAARVPVDSMIANSEHTLRGCERSFVGVPHTVCRCPVERSREYHASRDETRRLLGTSPTSVVIIQVGRMEPLKGQRVLIEALAKLRNISDWECWIVGGSHSHSEAAYRNDLIALVKAGGHAEKIKFLGHRNDIAELMQAADVCCQPNVGPESLGIVFIEALYAGVCVITSNFGGGAEIVSPECGILTPPGDVAALSDSLAMFIADSDFRRSVAVAGPARAAELCDPHKQIHRIYEALSQVE